MRNYETHYDCEKNDKQLRNAVERRRPCFNFNAPDEHFRADEIEKIGDKSKIETLVIGCDLPDYDFISDMVNLRQLYIYSGGNYDF